MKRQPAPRWLVGLCCFLAAVAAVLALVLGGAGIFDAIVISGILGVVLAELMGELFERIARGSRAPRRSAIQTPVKHQKEK